MQAPGSRRERWRFLLFTQGDPSDVVYFVDEGTIEVYRRELDGTESPVAVIGVGTFIGQHGADVGEAA